MIKITPEYHQFFQFKQIELFFITNSIYLNWWIDFWIEQHFWIEWLNITREMLVIWIAFNFYCKLLFAAICASYSAGESSLMLKSVRICSGLFPLIISATVLHEICNKPLTCKKLAAKMTSKSSSEMKNDCHF